MSFFKRETPHNHKDYAGLLLSYYTIPRNNRELQHNRVIIHLGDIIPYQEIIGNYSCQGWYGILESLSIPQNKKIPLLRII